MQSSCDCGSLRRRFDYGDLYKDGTYKPLARELFEPRGAAEGGGGAGGGGFPLQSWLDPQLVRAVEGGGEEALQALLRRECEDVYSFPCFTADFCRLLLAESDHARETVGPRLDRPNGMNRRGLVVNQLGLEPAMTALLQGYLVPLTRRLFPREGARADDHHCFLVAYQGGGADVGLDMHHDESDVTVNVCLGRAFQGATLRFCGKLGAPSHRKLRHVYEHEPGRAVVHLGAHRHGADDILAGERVNLIIWTYSQAFRASAAYQEQRNQSMQAIVSGSAPDEVCMSYTHDGDYLDYKKKDLDWAHKHGVQVDRVAAETIVFRRSELLNMMKLALQGG